MESIGRHEEPLATGSCGGGKVSFLYGCGPGRSSKLQWKARHTKIYEQHKLELMSLKKMTQSLVGREGVEFGE